MDEAAKKTVLRTLTYGLYAVTAKDGDQVNAFTANWLTQVSFEPPMVAVAIERDARSLGMIQRSGQFGVCVLERAQRELAGSLGRSSQRNPTKLAEVAHHLVEEVPVLDEALGFVVCRVRGSQSAGDHVLVVGEVVEAGVLREGENLTLREAGFRYAG
jgi:flavin reductase (DIM6/NTAB) family NADH-FMN oxidoreductase RutF